MQEEGLTNDEVKSHLQVTIKLKSLSLSMAFTNKLIFIFLQKYRLHSRKPNSNAEKQSSVVLGFKLWNSSQKEEESSKISNSQSGSPEGPLQLPSTTTTTGGDSSMEDAEDDKSECFQMERLRSP